LNVLITGAAGFLGTYLTRYLMEHNYIIMCVDNYAHPIADLSWHPQKPLDIDVSKPDWYKHEYIKYFAKAFVENCDVVVHLAATISVNLSVEQPELAVRNNIEGVLNVLEACRKHDKKMVYASSCEVYGSNVYEDKPIDEEHPLKPQSPYGTSKLAGELLCQTYRKIYGLQVNITRCFNFFGPYQREDDYGAAIAIFTRRCLNGEPPIVFGDGRQTRDYTYISDIVRAYDIAINNDFGDTPVNFCSGKETSINELADMIIRICGQEGKLERKYGSAREWELRRSWGNPSRALREYGWKPEISLEEGLKKYVEWYRETHKILPTA